MCVIFCGICFVGCTRLTQKVTDTSTPTQLAEVLVRSFVKNDENLYSKDVLLKGDDLEELVEDLNENGKVSIHPNVIKNYPKRRAERIEQWKSVRRKAEAEGVLWSTAKYYGCRYKMRQHPSLFTLSMNFEVYVEVGGYYYQIDIGSIAHEDSYYVYDKIAWVGEVPEPESVVLPAQNEVNERRK